MSASDDKRNAYLERRARERDDPRRPRRWRLPIIGHVIAARAAAMERAWLATLPFAVRGYVEALGDEWDDKARLHLHFSPTPDPEAARVALAATGEVWDHDSDMDTYILDRTFDAGREVRTLLRRLFGHPLQALCGKTSTTITVFLHR